jgi:hypothetical protein
MTTTRREFLRQLSLAALATPVAGNAVTALVAGKAPTLEEQKILDLINAHRPSRLAQLPADFNARFGSTHSDGKYYFSSKPFLIEGAEKLLELGTRLGKFWFDPQAVGKFYSFNSSWEKHDSLLGLAKSEYFQAVWRLPFKTIMLEANSAVDHGWRRPNLKDEFYGTVAKEYYDVTAYFYQIFHDRSITIVLQNWEGDWMLRGIGEQWQPPSPDWRERCEQMQRWFAARQAGVSKARAEFGKKSHCTVAHAVEVNRVADAWKGIPTVTRNVLPGVEVDLVSHSAYDGINSGDPLLFWKCLNEIRQYARTGSLFGPGALVVGEYGIPENDKPERIWERYDMMLGVMLAMDVRFAAHWDVYCNEFAGKPSAPPPTPVRDSKLMRGFWLVKPDGSLSEGGKYFHKMWTRADAEEKQLASTQK